MNDDIHIASFILNMKPEHLANNSVTLTARANTEVPHSDPNGKLIVVIEANSHAEVSEFLDFAHQLPGIIAINFVYHESNSASALAEELA